MSTNTTSSDRQSPSTDVAFDRYGTIQIDDTELCIYDEKNDDSWIQSDTWVDIGEIG